MGRNFSQALLRLFLFTCCRSSRTDIVLRGNGTVHEWKQILLAQHSPHPVPPIAYGKPLDIQVGFNVRHLVDVSVIGRHIILAVWLRIRWLDPSLLYTFDDRPIGWHGNYVPLQRDEIWAPTDILCTTCTGNVMWDFDPQGFYLFDAEYARDKGYNIHWARQGRFTSKCDVQLDNFPFDVQNCSVRFESWMYPSTYMHMFGMDPFAEVTELKNGTQDYEIGFEITNLTMKYDVLETTWPGVNFNVILQRKPNYYILNALLPMGLMVVLTNVVPWLPAEQAMSLLSFGVTLLLTSIASMLFTADKQPVSGSLTWLDRWQSCCISFTLFPIIESAAVCFAQSLFERYEKGRGAKHIHEFRRLSTQVASFHTTSVRRWLRPRDLDWVCRVLVPLTQVVVFIHLGNDPYVTEAAWRALRESSFLAWIGVILLLAFVCFGMLSFVTSIIMFGLLRSKRDWTLETIESQESQEVEETEVAATPRAEMVEREHLTLETLAKPEGREVKQRMLEL